MSLALAPATRPHRPARTARRSVGLRPAPLARAAPPLRASPRLAAPAPRRPRHRSPASAPCPRAPRPAASCSTSASTRPRPPPTAPTLHRIVEALRALTAEIAPSSETYAAVALAPEGAGGRDVDVVRLALQDPAALAKQRESQGTRDDADRHPNGVIIDISRKRVLLDGEAARPHLQGVRAAAVPRAARGPHDRPRTSSSTRLWAADDEAPNERTIDVHVRRLRSKLAHYEDIVRTVRGVGYRFDRHADVSIRQASTPCPDLF